MGMMVSAASFLGAPVAADWDPPGPPPLQVLLAVEGVRFVKIPDDGLNGKSELLLSMAAISRAGRAQFTEGATLDLEATHGFWDLNIAAQLGFECSPASPIALTYSLVELDNGGKEVAQAVLFTLARAAALYFWNPTFALAHLATGVVSSMLLPVINGNDDLGSGQTVVEADKGDWLLEMRGPDGGAQVHLRTVINEVPDAGQCGPKGGERTREPTGEPERRVIPSRKEVAEVYEPLHDTYWRIAEMRQEGRLTRTQMDRIRRTYMSLLLRAAGAVALQDILRASWEGGDPVLVREAWDHFLRAEGYARNAMRARGRETQDVNMDRALTAYERASRSAARALATSARDGPRGFLPPVGGTGSPFRWASSYLYRPGHSIGWAAVQASSGFELPLYLFLLPDYVAVEEGSALGIVALVTGAGECPGISASGAPAGMEVRVKPLGEVPGLFLVRIGTEGVPPGTYRITLTASAGGESVDRELTVVMEGSP